MPFAGRIVLIAWAALVAVAPSAEARGDWSFPVRISTEDRIAGNPELSMARSGRGYATWTEKIDDEGWVVAGRSLGASQGEIETLSETDDFLNPAHDVAVYGTGSAAIITRNWGADSPLLLRRRTPGGSLSPPVTIPTSTPPGQPQIAADVAGNVLLVWRRGPSDPDDRSEALRGLWIAPDNTVGPEFEIWDGAPSTSTSDVQLDMNPAGQAVVSWAQFTHTAGDPLARLISRTGLGPLTALSAGFDGDNRDPTARIDDNGRALAIWTNVRGDRPGRILARELRSSGTPAAAFEISDTEDLPDTAPGAHRAQLSVSPGGRAYASWHFSRTSAQGTSEVQGRARDAGGDLAPVDPIGSNGVRTGATQIVDRWTTAIVWAPWNTNDETLRGTIRSPGGQLDPAVELPAQPLPFEIRSASDHQGRAVLVWSTFYHAHEVYSAGYTAEPSPLPLPTGDSRQPATGHAPITLGETPVRVRIARARLSAKVFRLSGRRRLRLHFTLSASARVSIQLRRRSGRKWRRLGSITRRAGASRTTVRLDRLFRRRLRPGRYEVVLRARAEPGARATRRLRLSVIK